MYQTIWTVDALSSELAPYDGTGWRVVEAQHQISTQKLVDTLDEQQLLEEMLDEVKPQVPEAYAHLHFLLFTPFRYKPYPHASRFRRAGMTPGVFYASERVETAMAETVFYRYLFFSESPDTPFPTNALIHTAFAVALKTAKMLDLMSDPLAQDTDIWTNKQVYNACLDLSDKARETQAEIIRYQSVRDPKSGANLAVLDPVAFASPEPIAHQTWHIHIRPDVAQAICAFPALSLEFLKSDFADDRLN